MHQLAGAVGSATLTETTAAYYASIAETEQSGERTVRHRLRRDVGAGTIELTSLHSGLHIARYDVAFSTRHQLGYAFPDDHFELECCVDGRMQVSETRTGSGYLDARSVALSPRCATGGVVTHEHGERYRAVSITGTWTELQRYLGTHVLPDIGPESVARARYLGWSANLRRVADPLEEIFLHRRCSPGRLLFLESRVLAALAALVDGLSGPPVPVADLAAHEIAALRRVPELLWRQRHAPPTLPVLARACSMSVRRLNTGFRMLYGTSVLDHHRRRCLAHAATLLVDTDWPLSRIAHEVGYASPGNFGYAFRRDRGSTPAAFRRAHT